MRTDKRIICFISLSINAMSSDKIDDKKISSPEPVGRFAPSPSGRMHLGNVTTALLSWLSVRKRGGRWVLRIEDLDPQRSKPEYARQLEDDLHWLGIDWDEGGIDGIGEHGPYCQSLRHDFYEEALAKLRAEGVVYSCTCRRADLMATQAPHASDGRIVYSGRCRPAIRPPFNEPLKENAAVRLFVPDGEVTFTDGIRGRQCVNLARECGDFVLRRADGAWAYQLAVVADDAAMGVTEVLRGNDLLLSAAQQIYLYRLLGYPIPEYVHTPLLCNAAGQRLSKRDASMSMEALRAAYKSDEVIGQAALAAGIIKEYMPVSAQALVSIYNRDSITRSICVNCAQR